MRHLSAAASNGKGVKRKRKTKAEKAQEAAAQASASAQAQGAANSGDLLEAVCCRSTLYEPQFQVLRSCQSFISVKPRLALLALSAASSNSATPVQGTTARRT